MPASVADPIDSHLRHSLMTDNDGDGDFSKRLAASCSRALTTHIDYEQAPSYNPKPICEHKNKFIVLKSNNSVLPSTNTSQECVASPTNGLKICPDSVLPTPKLTLFPSELVQLGWQSKPRVHTGLVNVGNSCYLNASLQALFHVPALNNWLRSDHKHKEQCYKPNVGNECIICAMSQTLNAMQTKDTLVTRPTLIINKLKLIGRSLQHGQQEDAHEFMRLLIECMEKSFLTRYKGHKLDNYSKETTPLNQIFGGYIRTEVQCKRCSAISTTFQHFQDLQLDIQRVNGVSEALRTYFSLETLDRSDYSCKKCGKEVAATKRFYVERPPPVLFLQLKRFNAQGFKMNKCMTVPTQLDLTPFLRHKPAGHLNYRLTSLVNHSGSGAQCGHYTAVGRTCSGQLYTFDDSRVTPLGSFANCESNVYVIIYEQMKQGPAVSATLTAAPRSPFGVLANRPSLMCNKVSPTIIPTSHKPMEVRQSPLANKFIPAVITTPKKTVSCPSLNGHNRMGTNGNVAKTPDAVKRDTTPVKANGYLATPGKLQRRDATPTKEKPAANGHVALNGLVPYDDGDSSCSESGATTSNGERRLIDNAGSRVSDASGADWSVTERSRSTSAELEEGEIRRDRGNLKRKHDDKASGDRVNGNATTSSSNGNGRERPPEVAASNFYDRAHQAEKPQHAEHNGTKRSPTSHKPFSHNQSWEPRPDVSNYLKSQSHRGVPSNVMTWSNGANQFDRDAAKDFRDRRRTEDRSYDEDYDRGRSKKAKRHNFDRPYRPNHMYANDKKYTFQNKMSWGKNGYYKDHKQRSWGKDSYKSRNWRHS